MSDSRFAKVLAAWILFLAICGLFVGLAASMWRPA